MRFEFPLDTILGTQSRVKTLRVLCRFPSKEFTGRELARLARASAPQANQALGELEQAGLVHRRGAGAAILWQLRTENVLIPMIRELFARESTLKEDLIKTIRSGLPTSRVARAVLYGSVARGKEGGESDVDLFIEVADDSEKDVVGPALEQLGSKIYQRFGIPLSTIMYSSHEVKRPRNPRLMRNIDSEGLVIEQR
jgi:predicted nucleotidyltransferase